MIIGSPLRQAGVGVIGLDGVSAHEPFGVNAIKHETTATARIIKNSIISQPPFSKTIGVGIGRLTVCLLLSQDTFRTFPSAGFSVALRLVSLSSHTLCGLRISSSHLIRIGNLFARFSGRCFRFWLGLGSQLNTRNLSECMCADR